MIQPAYALPQDVRRTDDALMLLAMDVVRPFYDLMGVPSIYGLLPVIRSEMVETRRAAGEAQGPAYLSHLTEMFARIATRVGPRDAERLAKWICSTFIWSANENRTLQAWRSVLLHAARDSGLWERLFERMVDLQTFLEADDMSACYALQRAVDAEPLSDWDLHIYALKLFDDNLYPGIGTPTVPDGPRLRIVPTVRDYQGYGFWSVALRAMDDPARARLWRRGVEIVRDADISWVKNLPDPSTLERQ